MTEVGTNVRNASAGIGAQFRVDLHPSTWRAIWVCASVVGVISFYYVFLASVGTFQEASGLRPADYYDRMAEGFRAGHLYIQEQPSAELLAQRDPFAMQHVRLWLWDVSLYKGRYYMYWGPVPGLLLLAFKLLTGSHRHILDQWPTVIFAVGRLCAGAGLIVSLATRVRARQPIWVCALAVAVFGTANPLPFIVARPCVYEASLAGGQCFMFWGLLLAFWGRELPELRRSFFVAASVALSLSIGCRATNFVAVPLVVSSTLLLNPQKTARSWKTLALDALALGLPLTFAVGAYAVYNYARFDSVTEFGLHYQLTGQPFGGKSAYVVPNIFSYLFAPVSWSCRFPFVSILTYRPLSSWIHWPPGYLIFEKAGGVMRTAAWCWLLLLCVFQVAGALWQRVTLVGLWSAPAISRTEIWTLCCAAGLLASMAPVLKLWEASMRYAGDGVGGIVLASTVGAFWLLRMTYRARHGLFGLLTRVLIVALGLQTVVIGSLCAFTSSEDPIPNRNPALFHQLQRSLSLCESDQ